MARIKSLPGLFKGPAGIWQINKAFKGYGQLRESTGTRDYTEADIYKCVWIRQFFGNVAVWRFAVLNNRSQYRAASQMLLCLALGVPPFGVHENNHKS